MSVTESQAPALSGIEQLRAGLEAVGVHGIGRTLGHENLIRDDSWSVLRPIAIGSQSALHD